MKATELVVGRAYTNLRGQHRRILAADDTGRVEYVDIRQERGIHPMDRRIWITRTAFARWARASLPWSACCNTAYRIEGRTTRYCVCPACNKSCDP